METTASLETLEELFIQERRRHLEKMAKRTRLFSAHLTKLVELQRGLDALREAIEEEAETGPSVYEDKKPFM